ncbi:MAG: DNA methyltransferase, partial [Dolichospermum sp.]
MSWVKRNATPIHKNRLNRGHESCLIYSMGKIKQFYNTRGLYQDVKVPGILVDTSTVESVKTYISKLQQWISTGKQPIQKVSHKKQYLFNETKLNFTFLYRENGNFDANFTNVWSFAPTMHQPGRRTTGVYLHPNEKPLEIMKRLVEMLTPE